MDYSQIFAKIGTVLNFTLFELNKIPVTVSSVLMLLISLILIFFVSKLLNRILLKRILHRTQIDEGTQFTILRINHYLILIIGSIIAFQFVGINLSGLAVIFGFLSVGIGFGLQNITSNFVAGLILLFERPIKIGDRVLVGETEGDVLDINIRSTTIRSLNNVSIIVPNSEFVSNNVVNWSHGDAKIRVNIEVGVSYNSDLDTVLRSLQEVADEYPDVLKKPAPDVIFNEFGDSSWKMVLRVWIANPKMHHLVRSAINCDIVRKFKERGIEIPFPQMDMHLKNIEKISVVKQN